MSGFDWTFWHKFRVSSLKVSAPTWGPTSTLTKPLTQWAESRSFVVLKYVRFFWVVLSSFELCYVRNCSEFPTRERGRHRLAFRSWLSLPNFDRYDSLYRIYTYDFSWNTALFFSLDWQSTGDERDSLNTNTDLSVTKYSVRTHPPNHLPPDNKWYTETAETAIAVWL